MDLINRQDAIGAIEKLDIPEDMCVFEILSHIELAIGTLPSADACENTCEITRKSNANDTISRQNAIDAICHHGEIENDYTDIYHDGYCDGIYDAIDTIKALPSAERKGKWIRHTRVEPVYSIDGVETWGIKCQCNKCCFTTTVVEDFGYYSFCPNCGADMRGNEDERFN